MANRENHPPSDLRQALELHFRKAPGSPLRSAIYQSRVGEKIAEFDKADETAIKKQTSYRRFGRFALWAMLTGAVVGALVLLPIKWIEGRPTKAIEAIQGLALILTFLAVWWIGLRQSVGQWMGSRAEAERIRAEVFRAIVDRGGGAKDLLFPALQCFNDAHLDWQLNFFKKRAREHRQSAGHATRYKITGYFLLGISLLLGAVGVINFAAEIGLQIPYVTAAIQSYTIDNSGRWQIGLGAMASSILAFASARSFMDQDDRNACCYDLAAEELERIKNADLAKAEAAARAGDVSAVKLYCEKVQSVLTAEQSAWIFARRPPEVVMVYPDPKPS